MIPGTDILTGDTTVTGMAITMVTGTVTMMAVVIITVAADIILNTLPFIMVREIHAKDRTFRVMAEEATLNSMIISPVTPIREQALKQIRPCRDAKGPTARQEAVKLKPAP